MPLSDAARIPTATYRVQLHAGFTFADLERRLTYLKALGITDLYLSPLFTASPGSLHGYDVNDYGSISPEIGGASGFAKVSDRIREIGLGALVDMVPNHMGIAGPRNRWWRDVLAQGRSSAYASFFDIQWNGARGDERVLVPMLEDHYGKVLGEGKIQLIFEGAFYLRYSDVNMPLRARTQSGILNAFAKAVPLPEDRRREVEGIAGVFLEHDSGSEQGAQPQSGTGEGSLAALETRLTSWFTEHGLQTPLNNFLQGMNGRKGELASFAALHRLIEEQHYRLARWKAGVHEINYRRFFAINSLVGLRVEDPEVFGRSHALLSQLLNEGRITGVRVDHIDGLRRPAEYLERVQRLVSDPRGKMLYVVVEKILAPQEELPRPWPVQGTTGYEFIPQLAALLVDRTAEERITRGYQELSGDKEDYADAVYARKRLILDELFANAINQLADSLAEILGSDPNWRDLTRNELLIAIRELMACLSVYRTYRSDQGAASEEDRKIMEQACSHAIQRNPRADSEPFEFLRNLISGDYPPPISEPSFQQRLLDWVLTFQQYTGAVMAKSVEDTAFYTAVRFIALNEVGGNPGAFGGTVDDFHRVNQRRLEVAPHTLLTTSTHDTKLSEDVRARLYALSEVPDRWGRWAQRWRALNAKHRSMASGGEAPDAVDEYRLYQILLGAWPLDAVEVDDAFRERLRTHCRKAVEEGKRHTSPQRPNEAYLIAFDRFVDAVTSPQAAAEFLSDFQPCARTIARFGMINSLTQVILKCTVPGVPDFYQGNETWDFSLVDPDNRRPINFDRREELLGEIGNRSPRQLLEGWRDGGIKMKITQLLLRLRTVAGDTFRHGTYEPLTLSGNFAEHAVAFIRRAGEQVVLVVVPRLTGELGGLPMGIAWEDTHVELTDARKWRDAVSGREHDGATGFALRDLTTDYPFAVLSAGVTWPP